MKTHPMTMTMALVGASLFAIASACERPRDDEPTTAPTTAPTTTAPSTTRNVGEGERESAQWSTSSTGAGAAAADPRGVVEQFRQHVADDPAIAAVSNASLIYTVSGQYVLQGTAESDDVKDELEDYAEKLIGGEVKNDIEVTDK